MSNYQGDPYAHVEDAPLSREAETMQGQPGHFQYGQPAPQMYGYGLPSMPRLRRQYPIETKPFFLTSEFAAAVVAVLALAITAGASESIDAWRFWLLTTAITVGYLLSRGIAKSGTRSNASDPREQMTMNWPRQDRERDHH
jgi:hypothetical protein